MTFDSFFISVLFSLERNLVGNLRGATSCMEITAKAAGVSDPKDRTGRKKKLLFEARMKFTVKLQTWFP